MPVWLLPKNVIAVLQGPEARSRIDIILRVAASAHGMVYTTDDYQTLLPVWKAIFQRYTEIATAHGNASKDALTPQGVYLRGLAACVSTATEISVNITSLTMVLDGHGYLMEDIPSKAKYARVFRSLCQYFAKYHTDLLNKCVGEIITPVLDEKKAGDPEVHLTGDINTSTTAAAAAPIIPNATADKSVSSPIVIDGAGPAQKTTISLDLKDECPPALDNISATSMGSTAKHDDGSHLAQSQKFSSPTVSPFNSPFNSVSNLSGGASKSTGSAAISASNTLLASPSRYNGQNSNSSSQTPGTITPDSGGPGPSISLFGNAFGTREVYHANVEIDPRDLIICSAASLKQCLRLLQMPDEDSKKRAQRLLMRVVSDLEKAAAQN